MNLIVFIFTVSTNIVIQTSNVYNTNKFPYKILNSVHVVTSKRQIRRLLYINKKIDGLRLQESERRIRSVGVFRKVDFKFSADSDTLYIVTHDAFTAAGVIDLGVAGNRNNLTLGLEEHNLAGQFVNIGVYTIKDIERRYYELSLRYPGLIFNSMDINAYMKRFKGLSETYISYSPFLSPLNKWYVDLAYVSGDKMQYKYIKSVLVDSNRATYRFFTTRAGISRKTKNSALIPYVIGQRMEISTGTFNKIGAGVFFMSIHSRRYTHFIHFERKDYLQGGVISRLEYVHLPAAYRSCSFYLSFAMTFPFAYVKTENVLSINKSTMYMTTKEKIYAGPLKRWSFFSFIQAGEVTGIPYDEAHELIYFFSLGANNGMYAYNPFYFNGKKMLFIYGEMRFFGPMLLQSVSLGFAPFFSAGYAGDYLGKLYPSFGLSLRVESSFSFNSSIYTFNIGFKDFKSPPVFSFGTTLDFK